MKSHSVIIWLLCCSCSFSIAAEPCLHYIGEPVTLSGTVEKREFYGPPGYGENPETDSHETQGILLLTKSICVDANSAYYSEAEHNQLEVTLVPIGDTKLKDFMGKKVVVKGKLFHAETGHHHTPVLIEIDRIEESRK